jgi:hypothetical protein
VKTARGRNVVLLGAAMALWLPAQAGASSSSRALPIRTQLAPVTEALPTSLARRLQLDVEGPGRLAPADPELAYRLTCTTFCRGSVQLRAWLLRAGQPRRAASSLGFGPEEISISSYTGGVQRFSHRYNAGALRTLRHALNDGDTVELDLHASVHNLLGQRAQAGAVTRLALNSSHTGH